MIHVAMAEQHGGWSDPVKSCRQQTCRQAIRIKRAPGIEDQPRAAGRDEFDARAADSLRSAVDVQGNAQKFCSVSVIVPVVRSGSTGDDGLLQI